VLCTCQLITRLHSIQDVAALLEEADENSDDRISLDEFISITMKVIKRTFAQR
jgi:hypothetical protein